MRKTSEEIRQRVVELARQGLNQSQIAEAIGNAISRHTVRNILEDSGMHADISKLMNQCNVKNKYKTMRSGQAIILPRSKLLTALAIVRELNRVFFNEELPETSRRRWTAKVDVILGVILRRVE